MSDRTEYQKAQARRGANYDDVAENYGDEFIAEVGRRLVDLLNPELESQVLDVGAGRGAVTIPLLARGAHTWAMDISSRMVAVLREEAKGADVRRGDAARSGFPDSKFDAVTAGYLLSIVPEDIGPMFTEWRRVLRPGGKIAVAEPGPIHQAWFWIHELAMEFFDRPSPQNHNLWLAQTMKLIHEEARYREFSVLKSECFSWPLRFAGVDDAAGFLMSSGLRTALQASPSAIADNIEEVLRTRLSRILDTEGEIAMDRSARLLVFDSV